VTVQESRTFCRVCQGFCGVRVSVENNRIIRIVGDRQDPVSRGYICYKGARAGEQHHGPGRLLHSLHRVDGQFVRGDSEALLKDAGRQLWRLKEHYGSECIAVFQGTQSLFNALTGPALVELTRVLQTPRLFTTMTIDQSAKWIAEARMGRWAAGPQTFADADVWMLFGSNPLVSMVAAGGPHQFVIPDPVKVLREKKERGFQLIVIDPRRSETAEFATLHLQPKPGFDAHIAASFLHVILGNGWHDPAFCETHVQGLTALRKALSPFTPDLIGRLAGLEPADIHRAARVFARGRKGMAGSGTGTDMARHSNLAEHLVQAINVVCGRFPRAGDPVANPGVLTAVQAPHAQVVPPHRSWTGGPKSVSHGLGQIKGTMMSAEIVDDILSDSDRRIRALICVGGNPAIALPDQQRAIKALSSLELLIVIDPRITATSRLAHFVFAPKLQYERPDHTGFLESMFQMPFAHETDAILGAPADSDLVDDWYVLARLAEEAGCPLQLPIPAAGDSRELMRSLLAASRAPGVQAAERPGARLHAGPVRHVEPRQNDARFELLAQDVASELDALASSLGEDPDDARYLLIVRRHREIMNSTGTDYVELGRRFPGSPLYLHPEDMKALGVNKGDRLAIVRKHARLTAEAWPDPMLRTGVVAMSHGWSGDPADPWQATNALVDADTETQDINRMPVMTGIPVELHRCSATADCADPVRR